MILGNFKQLLTVALMLMAAVVAPQSLYAQCVTPPSGMVAWWPLDETAGPTADDIAGSVNNAGTWMNSPVPGTGMVAGALCFNGSNYVAVPDDPELDFGTGDLTVDAWIYPTNLSGIRPIVDKREDNVQAHGYTIVLLDGQLYFHLAEDSRPSSVCGPGMTNACQNYPSGVTVPINVWTHVAVTVDRNQPAGGLFYVNGVSVASFSPLTQAGDISNAGALWIGQRHPVDVASDPFYFEGCIDEVELFNRVLDPSEVSSIWAAGSAGKCVSQVCDCLPGDANGSGLINIADVVYLLQYIFPPPGGAPAPMPYPLCSGDANCNCIVNIADVVFLIQYIFAGGPAPCDCQQWLINCGPPLRK